MKNVLKRLCCMLLAIAMCSATFVSAASESTIGGKLEKAMYFLRELDIIGDYYDYNTDTAEKITRAEFADAVVRAMKIENKGKNDTYFYDVPTSHYACDSINALAEMGLIHGVGENRFEPDEYITEGAACKIVLSILGYDKIAATRGGTPEDYVKTAAEIELTSYVNADSILTRGGMFLLIFEMLDTPMYNINGFEGGSAIYEVDEEETFLKTYHNAFFGKGVVDGVRSGSFNEIKLSENEVDIDGTIYTAGTDLSDMLGEEVEFVAYMDEDWDEGEVKVAYRTNKTDVLNISRRDFVRFDKEQYKLFYRTAGKVKSIKIERDVSLIYNGMFIEKDISDRLNDGCALKVIKDKNGYSKIVAKNKTNIVVKSVDVSAQIITNMCDEPKSVVLSKYDTYYIKKDGETDMTLEKLNAGDVVSVYASYSESTDASAEYAELEVTEKTVSGTIESIETDGAESIITVDGIEYFDSYKGNYKNGESITLYLDADGEVAYAESTPSNDFAAYLISGRVIPDHDVYDEVLQLEMLKQDGNIVKLYCKEKLKIDDERVKDAYDAYDEFKDKSGEFKPQLVLIKTNEEGLISNIDTTGGKQEEGTLMSIFEDQYVMWKGVGYIGSNNTEVVAIDTAKTVVFRVPTKDMLKKGEETKDDYGIGSSDT